jgi:hypothetical protein
LPRQVKVTADFSLRQAGEFLLRQFGLAVRMFARKVDDIAQISFARFTSANGVRRVKWRVSGAGSIFGANYRRFVR